MIANSAGSSILSLGDAIRWIGNMFYTVTVNGTKWMFPVSLEDIGGASMFAEMKAITLMRYIRKALEDKTFVKAA
jgi:hypothetical protein